MNWGVTRVTFVPIMSGVRPCLFVVWRLDRPRSGPTAAAVEARVFTEGVPWVPGEYVAELKGSFPIIARWSAGESQDTYQRELFFYSSLVSG